jgi:hypothetical protein
MTETLEGKIHFSRRTFSEATVEDNLKAMQAFIVSAKLKVNQIANISFNQTSVNSDADNEITLFYLESPTFGPVASDFDFKIYNPKKPWKVQVSEAEKDLNFNERRVISLLHTPKSFGGQRFQVLCFVPQSNESSDWFKVHHIAQEGKQWSEFVPEVVGWLNNEMLPHNLISVSLFEEAHPNQRDSLHAVICYKGQLRSAEQADTWPEEYNNPFSHSVVSGEPG